MPDMGKRLGDWMVERRRELNLSQAQAAMRGNTSTATWGAVERGTNTQPNWQTRQKDRADELAARLDAGRAAKA